MYCSLSQERYKMWWEGKNIMSQTLTFSRAPLVPSLYTMYLSVLISQTDPAHQLCGAFRVITMLRQPLSLFVSLLHILTYC